MLIMLACGIPIPAHAQSIFGTFHRILVEIGDEQSIEQDLSTFSARIQGLTKMCEVASEGVLILIDEIGTGTDPAEGAALAQAGLEHFASSKALTIVTTHHGTLKAYAHQTPGIENGSMDFNEQTLKPTFFFRQGLPGSSYAFRIASRIGLDRRVLMRARQILGKPEITLESLITSYRDRISKLESRLNISVPEKKSQQEIQSEPSRTKVRLHPGKAAPVPSSLELKVGQQALIDDGNFPCEILSIERRHALVAAGNMHMKVALERLRPVHVKKLHKKGKVNRSAPQAMIDIRGFRVDEAIPEVEKLLNQATGTSLSHIDPSSPFCNALSAQNFHGSNSD